jgi:Flp pilus assembly protein TadG
MMRRSITAFAFNECRSGNVAVTFGLCALPLFLVAGASIDYGGALREKAYLQQAVDSTALQVAKAVASGASSQSYANSATRWFAGLVSNSGAVLSGSPVVNVQTGEVCVTASQRKNTTMMKLAQVDFIDLSATGCAAVASGTFEIALVLDTTGSMAANAVGGTKLSAMKTAAKQFVDYMMDSQTLGSRTKMALVPFAAAVRLDPALYRTSPFVDTAGQSSWTWKSPAFTADGSIAATRYGLFTYLKSVRSSWDWRGCFESPPYPQNVRDSAPSSDPETEFVPLLSPDEPDATYSYTYYDSKHRLKEVTVSDPNEYANDYIDDHSSQCAAPQPTGSTNADERIKQSRLCKYKSAIVRSTSSLRGPNALCTTEPLIRLQSSKISINSTIDQLEASGSTNIHEGFMWGWRTVSPNAPLADGRPYATATNNKVIVLMSDGENTWDQLNNPINRSRYSTYGYYTNANGRLPLSHQNVSDETSSRAAMDALTLEACSNARAQGIKIYTIGFSGTSDPIDPAGKALLTQCAGDPARAHFTNSSSGLQEAFSAIGAGITELRLVR